MARQTRIQVTVSPEMSLALDVLAQRTGLSVSAQAMVILRQGLERTMQSAAVQSRRRAQVASRTAADWRSDQGTETMVETVYGQFGPATREEEAHLGLETPSAGRKAPAATSRA
jgi:hypothetical protein